MQNYTPFICYFSASPQWHCWSCQRLLLDHGWLLPVSSGVHWFNSWTVHTNLTVTDYNTQWEWLDEWVQCKLWPMRTFIVYKSALKYILFFSRVCVFLISFCPYSWVVFKKLKYCPSSVMTLQFLSIKITWHKFLFLLCYISWSWPIPTLRFATICS